MRLVDLIPDKSEYDSILTVKPDNKFSWEGTLNDPEHPLRAHIARPYHKTRPSYRHSNHWNSLNRIKDLVKALKTF